MKKNITLIFVAVIMALVLATCVACTPVNPIEPCTVHKDGNTDGICDVCGEEVEIPDPTPDHETPCTHTYDNACDTTCNLCGAVRTVDEHVDADTNGKCDNCGATVEVPINRANKDFTTEEKEILIELFGEVVPFMPNDTYNFGVYTDEDFGTYVYYYTDDNTQAEFDAYLVAIQKAGFTFDGTDEDYYGDTWYLYSKGNILLDTCFYEWDEGLWSVDTQIYLDGEGGTGGSDGGDDQIYTDFTTEEKEMLIDTIGEVIPFVTNTYYYINNFSSSGEIWMLASDVTVEDYALFLEALEDAGYTLTGTEEDKDGDIWYLYSKNDFTLEVCRYIYGDVIYFELNIYYSTEDGGDVGGGDTDEDIEILNPTTGLPNGTNGVYDVDFNDATYVKNVTDQGYYLGGCPTMGNVKVLVIPVEFADCTASSKGYSVSQLEKAFNSNDSADGFYSVYEYFYTSSYSQLSLTFDVLDNWFRPQYDSEYYQDATDEDGYAIGDQLIIHEALTYLESRMNLSEFDSDGNGVIDAVVLINTLDVGEDDFHWAYRYWNTYTDEDGYYYIYDDVYANDYLWASYQFLHEAYDVEGTGLPYYTDTTVFNTYTFIHEFSHVLGADDYYDTEGINSPMQGVDMMDEMFGDHNAYTKINYGWIASSRLVTAEESVTLTLTDFATTGDTIIIANNWDSTLGAYQEYYIIMYYTNVGLNGTDEMGYFSRDGIVVYHVNATLYKEIYEGETYYDVYNNNTDASGYYGTENNLIEIVKSANDTFTYIAGDTMPTVYLDNGDALIYNFVVESIYDGTATITFTKAN